MNNPMLGMKPWNKGIPQTEKQKKEHSARMKGRPAWNKGIPTSENVKNKLSSIKKGKPIRHFVENSDIISHKISERLKGRTILQEWRMKISHTLVGKYTGEKAHQWKGGQKLTWARSRNKRRLRGFILLTNNNPYTEPIEYHHVHPDLPYVVPCPTRIHEMFRGKTHFQNVNAMLGFRFVGVELCRE